MNSSLLFSLSLFRLIFFVLFFLLFSLFNDINILVYLFVMRKWWKEKKKIESRILAIGVCFFFFFFIIPVILILSIHPSMSH